MRPRDPNKIELIQNATLEVNAKEGFYGITIKKISERSGLSVGAIYTYFKGKEEILESLLDKSRELREQEYPLLFSENASVREDFEVIWNTVYQFESENFQLVMVAEAFFYSSYITDEKKANFLSGVRSVLERIKRGIDSGGFKNQQPMVILKHILANVRSLIVAKNRDSFEVWQIIDPEVFKEFVWDGIKAS